MGKEKFNDVFVNVLKSMNACVCVVCATTSAVGNCCRKTKTEPGMFTRKVRNNKIK